MKTRSSLIVCSALAALTLAVPRPASAEWSADLYVGAAVTQSRDFKATETLGGVRLSATAQDVDFDTSVSFGGRVGYWFESIPILGLGLDAFHFRPDVGSQRLTVCLSPLGCIVEPFEGFDLSVTSVSLDLMLRWPLWTSAEFPKGRLQPYLTAGPALFIARGSDRETPASRRQSDTDTSLGVKAGAGLVWLFHKNVGLFGEYRFTHFSPEFNFRDVDALTGAASRVRLTTDVNTHHLLGGIAFRF